MDVNPKGSEVNQGTQAEAAERARLVLVGAAIEWQQARAGRAGFVCETHDELCEADCPRASEQARIVGRLARSEVALERAVEELYATSCTAAGDALLALASSVLHAAGARMLSVRR